MLGQRLLRAASLDQLWTSRRLLWGLVLRQLQSGFAGSAGGWAWVVLRPLFTVTAYYFVFALVMAVRLDVEAAGTGQYALYLLAGLIPWLAFADGLVQGSQSLVQDAGLLKKTRFPVEVVPARTVVAAALGILPFVLLVGVAGLGLARGNLMGMALLGAWMGIQVLLTYQLALALAVLTAALRDVGQLVQAVVPMLIFFSPVLYPPDRVPAVLKSVLWLNPFTPLANGYHSLALQGRLPSGADLVVLVIWTTVAALFARLLLLRSSEQLVDWL